MGLSPSGGAGRWHGVRHIVEAPRARCHPQLSSQSARGAALIQRPGGHLIASTRRRVCHVSSLYPPYGVFPEELSRRVAGIILTDGPGAGRWRGRPMTVGAGAPCGSGWFYSSGGNGGGNMTEF